MQKVNGDGEFAYFVFTVTQPRQFVTVFFLSRRNKMFRFPSPCLLRWWVGRSGKKKKKKENEHLKGSGSREGQAAKVRKPSYKVNSKTWSFRSLFVVSMLIKDEDITSYQLL